MSVILCGVCRDFPGQVCDACGNGLVPPERRRVPFRRPLEATRWTGQDPLLVIAILEARLGEARRALQVATGNPPTSRKAKRLRRNARRHGATS